MCAVHVQYICSTIAVYVYYACSMRVVRAYRAQYARITLASHPRALAQYAGVTPVSYAQLDRTTHVLQSYYMYITVRLICTTSVLHVYYTHITRVPHVGCAPAAGAAGARLIKKKQSREKENCPILKRKRSHKKKAVS